VYVPAAGHLSAILDESHGLWDLARRKGLTYRYGEYAERSSDGRSMQAAKGTDGLWGMLPPISKRPASEIRRTSKCSCATSTNMR
jgi:hypothetical protein